MVQTRRSGPAQGRPDSNLNQRQGNPEPPLVPTARALMFPATGRRSLDVAIVSRCPWCKGSGHLHRGLALDGAIRGSGCEPRREYRLVARR